MAEQRKSRRFELKLPIELVRSGSRQITHIGETRNVSSGGVLLGEPPEALEIGQPIEYMITLPTGANGGEVRLRCMGKVVRLDENLNTFAITLERYEFVRSHAARV